MTFREGIVTGLILSSIPVVISYVLSDLIPKDWWQVIVISRLLMEWGSLTIFVVLTAKGIKNKKIPDNDFYGAMLGATIIFSIAAIIFTSGFSPFHERPETYQEFREFVNPFNP